MSSPALRHVLLMSWVAAFCALAATDAHGQLGSTVVASGFDRPLGMVPYPGMPGTFLVFEQAGRVRVLQSGVIAGSPFLDLRTEIASGGEQGLLGLALAPDFAVSGRVFLSFTNRTGDSVIARFTRSAANPLVADASSRFDLRWPSGERVIRQPFTNHNGGHITFGSDGYLYLGMGDGGSGNDPMNLAQDPTSLLGKMLRIDVSVSDAHANGYVVPPANPFVGRAGVLPEIWAFGLRNPWRWNFDDTRLGGTGALLIGDVGQSQREEIDYEPRGSGGRNYGWSQREGLLPNLTNRAAFSAFTDPIFDYGRDVGRSVTGGYVYRGRALGTAYTGRYFFADFVTSRVWSLAVVVNSTTREAHAETVMEHTAELGAAAASPASFAVDANGELYLLGYGGTIHRIDGPDVPPAPEPTIRPRRPYASAPVGIARPRPSPVARRQ